MSTNIRWNAIRLATIAVYLFLFVPIVAVILLSFNQRQFGGFPIEGFRLRWYTELFNNDTIRRAAHTSLKLGEQTEILSSILGVLASMALDRKSVVWGKSVSVGVDPGGRRIIKTK